MLASLAMAFCAPLERDLRRNRFAPIGLLAMGISTIGSENLRPQYHASGLAAGLPTKD
jgi:hypothetical protein